jgi:Mg-chelatase subunit ChlD
MRATAPYLRQPISALQSTLHHAFWWLCLGGILCVAAPVCAAQEQVKIEGVTVVPDDNQVKATVRVLDTASQPQRGLGAAQFSARVNGQPVTVEDVQAVPIGAAQLFVALVFDTSGSMSGQLDAMRQQAAAMLQGLSPDDKVAVLAFDAAPRVLLNLTRDKQVALSVIQRLQTNRGNTAVFDAVDAARATLERAGSSQRAIVVFSDGADNASALRASELARLSQHDEMPPVYVVWPATANATGTVPQSLRQLTGASGGALITANSATSLAASLDALRRDAYELRCAAPARGSGEALLQVLCASGVKGVAPVASQTAKFVAAPLPRQEVERQARQDMTGAMAVVGVFALGFVLLVSWRRQPATGSVPATAWLVATQGPQQGHHFYLQDGSVIGRAKDVQIRLTGDDEISRRHARFSRDESGHFLVQDIGSTNGFAINGQVMREATLRDGDQLLFGSSHFVFQTRPPVNRTSN